MRPGQLVLRCYAERTEGFWQAYCLDFSLGCQGDSFEEVKGKLEAQIGEYVYDALVGEDRPHAAYLMKRRASIAHWLSYWRIWCLCRVAQIFGVVGTTEHKRFKEVLPVVPVLC